jgi:hypothetical protein
MRAGPATLGQDEGRRVTWPLLVQDHRGRLAIAEVAPADERQPRRGETSPARTVFTWAFAAAPFTSRVAGRDNFYAPLTRTTGECSFCA